MARLLAGLGLLITLGLAACSGGGGGGGGGGSGSGSAAPAPVLAGGNVLPISIDAGPPEAGNVNVPYVSVTICVPGTTTCQTIDHVLLDTGSYGLRIINSKLSLTLPAQTAASGANLAECAVFADGYSWGSVRIADVKLADRIATALPIEIIADPAFPDTPATCSSQGPKAENTVASFGANGVLGVGSFVEDCGPACVSSAIAGTYYTCPVGVCGPVAVSLDKQVQNPVARLSTDNNGVVVSLPSVGPGGANSVAGSLMLGIGTQSNNGLGSAVVLDLDSFGNFETVFDGATYSAFLDTGSNGLFFDSAIPVCPAGSATPGFYCPLGIQALSAVLHGASNGQTANINFSIANGNNLAAASPGAYAFSNLGGPFGVALTFDWGLPFFYGRTVFTAIEGRITPGGTGPYVAF